MKNFVDRQPSEPGRRKITYGDGTSEYVTVEMANEPIAEGTPLNRAAMLAVQGFEAKTTAFGSDGSITETTVDGDVKKTVFQSDGSIKETLTGADGSVVTKTTTFLANGNIMEVLS